MSKYAAAIVFLMMLAPAAGLAQTPPPLVQRSYPVADLVVPLERAATPAGREKDAVPDVSMGPRFVQLIVGTIEPKSCAKAAGPASSNSCRPRRRSSSARRRRCIRR